MACAVARVLLDSIFSHYGLPLTRHSDNAPEFTSKIWEEFSKLCRYHISHSSPYWPQGNAVYESSLRTLIIQLRTRLLEDNTKDWSSLIPTTQWGINNSQREDSIMPFE